MSALTAEGKFLAAGPHPARYRSSKQGPGSARRWPTCPTACPSHLCPTTAVLCKQVSPRAYRITPTAPILACGSCSPGRTRLAIWANRPPPSSGSVASRARTRPPGSTLTAAIQRQNVLRAQSNLPPSVTRRRPPTLRPPPEDRKRWLNLACRWADSVGMGRQQEEAIGWVARRSEERRCYGQAFRDQLSCELGWVADLSMSGMRASGEGKCPVERGETLCLNLTDSRHTQSVNVEVVWTEVVGNEHYQVGLAFFFLSAEARRTLSCMIPAAGERLRRSTENLRSKNGAA